MFIKLTVGDKICLVNLKRQGRRPIIDILVGLKIA
jgi:hypothetical protein